MEDPTYKLLINKFLFIEKKFLHFQMCMKVVNLNQGNWWFFWWKLLSDFLTIGDHSPLCKGWNPNRDLHWWNCQFLWFRVSTETYVYIYIHTYALFPFLQYNFQFLKPWKLCLCLWNQKIYQIYSGFLGRREKLELWMTTERFKILLYFYW